MTVSPAPWDGIVARKLGTGGLVERALARERAAESELYRRHARKIRRFALEMLGDPTDANDAVQETFARAFRQLSTLSEPGAFSRWLYGIARNVSLECLKARRSFRRICSESATLISPASRDDPERSFADRQSLELAARSLARMPAARRRALMLRTEQALSYQSIARKMGWSLAKTKIELYRGRRELRAILAFTIVALLAMLLAGARAAAPPSRQPDDASLMSVGPDAGSAGAVCEAEVGVCKAEPRGPRSGYQESLASQRSQPSEAPQSQPSELQPSQSDACRSCEPPPVPASCDP